MKIKEGFVLREIAGTVVVVPTGNLVNEFQGMINLNETGKFIWELLNNNVEINEISIKLAEKYKIDEDIAKEDVKKFIQKMKDAKIIEE